MRVLCKQKYARSYYRSNKFVKTVEYVTENKWYDALECKEPWSFQNYLIRCNNGEEIYMKKDHYFYTKRELNELRKSKLKRLNKFIL